MRALNYAKLNFSPTKNPIHLKRVHFVDRVRDLENRAKVTIGPSTQNQIICLKTREVCVADQEAIDENIKWKDISNQAQAHSTHLYTNRVKY